MRFVYFGISWLCYLNHYDAARVLSIELRDQVQRLFDHGYSNYMQHAFPEDELRPISCSGRGKDRSNDMNLGINDVCGDFGLTLIDTLDTLCVLGRQDDFTIGVRNVIDTITFDVDSNVQVFEVTIRVLGGLLSAHQYATMPTLNCAMSKYNNELLEMALDLGSRLLPAFASPTGIPYPRINLKYGLEGLPKSMTTETCAAGAGSLLLEFSVLSRLTGDMRFEEAARTAFRAIWDRRMELGLVGNTIDANSGVWTSNYAGVGAGIDSFYEYALKAWVLLGDDYFYDVWNQSQTAINIHVLEESGCLLQNIHLRTGFQLTQYIDSLSAFYPGLLVLTGDIERATKIHLMYQSIWTRFHALPERYNFVTQQVDIPWYLLRPEFIESTYFLYRATKDPFYLATGRQVLEDLTKMKQKCGFATLTSVLTRKAEDRMESFMLSETLKYLYLLFDEEHPLNSLHSNWVFTTEGHPLFLPNDGYNKTKRTSPHVEKCQVAKTPALYSHVMSHPYLSYTQYRAGLINMSDLPGYFPALDPLAVSVAIKKRTEIEVLFGAVAASVANASANFVQIGRDIMIKSLLGLRIKFERKDALWQATHLGHLNISADSKVKISDPLFEQYTTEGLVNFTPDRFDTQFEVCGDDDQYELLEGMTATHGRPLPTTKNRFQVVSMLNTSNADGCICPAILQNGDRNQSPESRVIILSRGGCSFLEKAVNAAGLARFIIVVDATQQGPPYVRPTLTDADGSPLSNLEAYPSVVFVQGFERLQILLKARNIVIKQTAEDSPKIRLVIRGEEVRNVAVSLA